MILKKGSFSDFAQRVKTTGKKIIVYGAGVIGQVVAPYWLHRYQLDNKVLCYVDADPHKQGQLVQLPLRGISVQSLAALDENSGGYILLITVSAFASVVQKLDEMQETEAAEVYFLPIMLLDIAHSPKQEGVVKTSDRQLIPKKIHYTWFSGEPIPEKLQKCVDSWKYFCPDYEIICWNADNYDISKYEYTRQAYTYKKWGFIADVARLDILYEYGGIYLDIDVELIRNLDELLYEPAFCATEKWGIPNAGGCSGAQAGNPVIKAMLDFRKNIPFVRNDDTFNQLSSGYFESFPLIERGLEMNGHTQTVADSMMTVYASEFFHPFDYTSGETKITKNTFSIHHFSGAWLDHDAAEERAQTKRLYQEFLSRLED